MEMAREPLQETLEIPVAESNGGSPPEHEGEPSDLLLGRNSSFSRLNAQAPEFVPRASSRADLRPRAAAHPFALQNSAVHSPRSQNHGSFQYPEQEIVCSATDPEPSTARDNSLSEDVIQKVVNQVEYYFSDINLATTDHLMRFINKDPEGFVPISVVQSFKKIKALVSSPPLLANALQTSSKLVVSEDGKKVKRRDPFTETNMEELQSRIVIAENLPEDHSYQNLMRVFSAAGSVKTIRTCPPQTSNSAVSAASRSGKLDLFFGNKLHAFVEYESVELAEKAVVELNDGRNWRSGLKVRVLLSCMGKHVRGRRAGHKGDWNGEDDDMTISEQPNQKQEDEPLQSETLQEHLGEEILNGKDTGARRGKVRGRGKGRGRGHYHNNRSGGHAFGTPSSGNSIHSDHPTVTKQPPGPRMPDGTRGFTFGRGKPISTTATE